MALYHGRRPNLIVAWLACWPSLSMGHGVRGPLYVGRFAPTVLIFTAPAAAVMGVSRLNANVASPALLAAAIALSALPMNGLMASFAPSLKTVWVAPRLAAAVEHHAQCPRPEWLLPDTKRRALSVFLEPAQKSGRRGRRRTLSRRWWLPHRARD